MAAVQDVAIQAVLEAEAVLTVVAGDLEAAAALVVMADLVAEVETIALAVLEQLLA